MGWKALVILALLLIAFLFPVFSEEASLPKDLSSDEIAGYLGNVLAYWKRVLISVFRRVIGNFSLPLKVMLRGEKFGKKCEGI
ncbi:MAG: hypothetical protein QMD36_06570 [Candidatus Aenigmarchaeota archaeon]|nr:hypothetical protein [Candidatus Aenigmarchaeota archaeon]